MDLLKFVEDVKGWVGTGAVSVAGGLFLKWKRDRRSELEILVNELQEECARKGIENERLNKLAERLHKTTNRQRLEIFFHNRLKSEAIDELKAALEKVKSNSGDCLSYISRAISKLEENVIVPIDDEEEKDENENNEASRN